MEHLFVLKHKDSESCLSKTCLLFIICIIIIKTAKVKKILLQISGKIGINFPEILLGKFLAEISELTTLVSGDC